MVLKSRMFTVTSRDEMLLLFVIICWSDVERGWLLGYLYTQAVLHLVQHSTMSCTSILYVVHDLWKEVYYHFNICSFDCITVAGLVGWLFNVTINNISVIYVTADWRRRQTYGRAPNAIDISYGSLTCPSKHGHGATLFVRLFRENRPISSPFTTHWGYGGHILDLNPRVLAGELLRGVWRLSPYVD